MKERIISKSGRKRAKEKKRRTNTSLFARISEIYSLRATCNFTQDIHERRAACPDEIKATKENPLDYRRVYILMRQPLESRFSLNFVVLM